MSRFQRGLMTAVTVVGLASLASAAAAQSVHNWTGFYVGGNAGYAWGSSTVSTATAGPTFPPGYFAATSITAINDAGTAKLHPKNFEGGIQAGYNWQTGPWVLGVEVEFDSFHLSASRTVSGIYPCCAPSSYSFSQSVSTNWLFTARPRLGWATNNWLFYVTGGVAVTNLKNSNIFVDNVFNNAEIANVSKTKAGWIIGAGAETALSQNWSVRIEYLYMDFGSVAVNGALVPTPALIASGNTVPNPFTHSASLTANVVRLGANYRF